MFDITHIHDRQQAEKKAWELFKNVLLCLLSSQRLHLFTLFKIYFKFKFIVLYASPVTVSSQSEQPDLYPIPDVVNRWDLAEGCLISSCKVGQEACGSPEGTEKKCTFFNHT